MTFFTAINYPSTKFSGHRLISGPKLLAKNAETYLRGKNGYIPKLFELWTFSDSTYRTKEAVNYVFKFSTKCRQFFLKPKKDVIFFVPKAPLDILDLMSGTNLRRFRFVNLHGHALESSSENFPRACFLV